MTKQPPQPKFKEPRSFHWIEFLRDRAGSPAVEFAFIAPVLCMLLFGTFKFAIVLNNYISLTDGVRVASRQFAISRSTITPLTTATSAVTSSAGSLTASKVIVTASVNGSACASDAACVTALARARGAPATVKATYACDLKIMGVDYSKNCTLTSQSTERVE